MKEYIEREAISKAYMDLCLAKSKLAKSRKGATFFQSDLLPETEPTTKELFRLVMAMPTADVAEVRHGKIIETIKDGKMNRVFSCYGHDFTELTCWYMPKYCPNCGARMDKEDEHGSEFD